MFYIPWSKNLNFCVMSFMNYGIFDFFKRRLRPSLCYAQGRIQGGDLGVKPPPSMEIFFNLLENPKTPPKFDRPYKKN